MRNIFLFTVLVFMIHCLLGQPLDIDKIKNLKIRNVGPANMSGRITAIEVVNANPKIIYVGAASGGVWKSENGGTAWKPVFDDQPTQNIGAIAIEQNNPSVIWIGTGEGNPRNSMNLGMGIFKSIDGGKSWQHLGLGDTKTIHRIIIDPVNPEVVYVGALGDPFSPNEHRGLYRTKDGGRTWTKILYTNDQAGIADLVMDPSNPKKLIAAMYEHRRTPYYFTSGGKGSGLFMTLDGGDTWKAITEQQGMPSGDLGRIGLAIAPSNTNRMYAKVEAAKNALYRSEDGGYTWSKINDNPRFTNNRPFYFQELAVDSKDANRLYNIYQPLSVSYDGGITFDPVPMIPADETKGIHADFHAFWINSNDPHHFIIGGDGGIGITHDHGKSWYFPETIPVAQFYHINVDNDRPYNVYGGMQDNGNWSGPGYTWKRGGIRTLYWQYLVGGDGFYISPDEEDSRFGFGNSQNGDLYRYDKLTGYYSSVKPYAPDGFPALRFNWNAGFARDPHDNNTVYYGSQFLHVSTDRGANWQVISPDLSTNNPAHQKGDYGGLTLDISGAEMYNSILSIAPSPIKKETIWVGTDDGNIHLTRDTGKTWQLISNNIKGLPKEAWIARIVASKYSEGTAWVVVNNYRKGDFSPYLLRTENFGQSWKQVVNNTQVKGYALSFIQDSKVPNLLFLGTENGLWVSIDYGQNWVQFKNGFPSVSTMDLKIQETESALIVGSFGRAIWVLDDLLSLREIAANRVNKSLTALPMNDAVQVKGLFIAPPGNIWTGFHTTFEGENRVFQKVEIPYFLKDVPKKDQGVTAKIFNSQNELIQTVSQAAGIAGLNYLVWKLDEQSATLPGAWIHDESRGIPVLPGDYEIVISIGDLTDTTKIKVISDPRFDVNEDVDAALYAFKKAVDVEVASLSNSLGLIDVRMARVQKLSQQLSELNYAADHELVKKTQDMTKRLDELRAKGQTPRPNRQVGAWQTLETSPYSKVSDALQACMSRVTMPSDQDLKLVVDAKKLVASFGALADNFISGEWSVFEQEIRKVGISWLDEPEK